MHPLLESKHASAERAGPAPQGHHGRHVLLDGPTVLFRIFCFFFSLVGVFSKYQLEISTEAQFGLDAISICRTPSRVWQGWCSVALDPYLLDLEGIISVHCTQGHQKVRTTRGCGLHREREQNLYTYLFHLEGIWKMPSFPVFSLLHLWVKLLFFFFLVEIWSVLSQHKTVIIWPLPCLSGPCIDVW